MGLAHTQDMDYGMITAKTVAAKEFMLQPNMPRFVRVGDNVNVAASLINLSEKEVKGVVRLELFVPETEKVILVQKQPFMVKAGETGMVSFSFDVSDKYESLAVRMVADGDTFSDGEQRYLPVLSNKQKLTESVLLDVNGAGSYTFSLELLFNHHSKTVTRPKMWVEFTGNPLWYAVQALKTVSNPENDNALSWASAYYANALLGHLFLLCIGRLWRRSGFVFRGTILCALLAIVDKDNLRTIDGLHQILLYRLIDTTQSGTYYIAKTGQWLEAYRLLKCEIVDIAMVGVLLHLALAVVQLFEFLLDILTLGIYLDQLISHYRADIDTVKNREECGNDNNRCGEVNRTTKKHIGDACGLPRDGLAQ